MSEVSISDFMQYEQPLETGAAATYPYSPALEKHYRFTSRFDDEVLLHRIRGNYIDLPRGLCPVGKIDNRAEGEPVAFPKCPDPRDAQVQWFNDTTAYLTKGQSGITVAGTGAGKTVCGYFAAYHMGVKTLVVTTKDDIYHQWIDGACGTKSASNPDGKNFLGLTREEVGEIRQDKFQVDRKFVVAMIHSLTTPDKYPVEMLDQFGLAIFDECHRVPANQFEAAVWMIKARLRMGLSADHRRSDGKELLFEAHVGPVRARSTTQLMVPKVLRFTTAWQCPRVMRTDKKTGTKKVVKMPHEAGQTTQMEKILAADPERNHVIASSIRDAYEKGRKIVVFSTLLDHLNTLHRALCDLGISGREIGHYGQATSKKEREARDKVKAKTIILTTDRMMGEGTDIPWLDLCALTMPRSNVEQVIGRIRREYPDKPQPVVFDFIDADSPVFLGYAVSRKKYYDRIEAEVVDI